uniref:Uncharacterized protein n=1 Tax=Arion vulgaris TaxID=1028688 RepID=A0A0B7A7R7_9EUPU
MVLDKKTWKALVADICLLRGKEVEDPLPCFSSAEDDKFCKMSTTKFEPGTLGRMDLEHDSHEGD